MRRLALALVQQDGDTVSTKVTLIPFVASSSCSQVLTSCWLLLGAWCSVAFLVHIFAGCCVWRRGVCGDHFIFNQFSAVLETVVFFALRGVFVRVTCTVAFVAPALSPSLLQVLLLHAAPSSRDQAPRLPFVDVASSSAAPSGQCSEAVLIVLARRETEDLL